ncbi:hypothetical protein METP2_02032 [Methanosarcinales archaeon]|nr:hypothetical protein METP2_02032 [Methanosarcinales archaeon]
MQKHFKFISNEQRISIKIISFISIISPFKWYIETKVKNMRNSGY